MFSQSYFNLNDMESDLNKCNSIKYAAYRTAAKLRVVQKALHLDKVELRIISSVFERHQLQQTENSVQLDEKEVESILSDIYFVIKKEKDVNFTVDSISQLTLNFLLNVFDKKNSNTIQVFSFKVSLTLLCEAKPREKYCYLFDQLADHNNCMSRKKLELFLKKVIRLTEHLGEGLSFGSELIPGTVESCFQCNVGCLGLSEESFMSWLMQDPQLLVWLSTFYRIQISETVSHNAKCGICKIYPLTGLRYRCLRCLSYDMCQSCFFTGKLNKKHKLKHPVQEYCCPMTSQQLTKAFLLTLRNRLYKKDCKLQYLPALRVDSRYKESWGILDEMEVSSRTVINGSRISLHRFPYKELQNIILQLERESERIIPQIEDFCSRVKDLEGESHLRNCLMKHKAQMRTQVQRLRALRKYLLSSMSFDRKAFLASTPVVDEILSKSQKRELNVDLANLSPITLRACSKLENRNDDKKMMWDNYDLGSLNPSWEEVQSGNVEKTFADVSKVPKEVSGTEESKWKEDDESDSELSTWLAGKTIRELDSSSRKGITWLYSDVNWKSDEEKIREENEKVLEELQFDLKKILNKIQELSVVTLKEEADEGANVTDMKQLEVDMVSELDTLLADLVNGIEKLMDS